MNLSAGPACDYLVWPDQIERRELVIERKCDLHSVPLSVGIDALSPGTGAVTGHGDAHSAGRVRGPEPQSEVSTRSRSSRCRPACLDGGAAFWAEEWAALGDGPPDGVDDVGEAHLRDFTGCLDRSVGGASSGLSLDSLGHGLPPVRVGGLPELAPARQPGELADSDEKAGGSPDRDDQQVAAGEPE